MELGEILRDRRKAAGRTIASVAMDAGLSVPYIANLENGRGNPTMAALDRLATALGARLEVGIADETRLRRVPGPVIRRLALTCWRARIGLFRSSAPWLLLSRGPGPRSEPTSSGPSTG